MITASMPMVKQCPFRDELDVGTVELTWPGEAPDLHLVAKDIHARAGHKVTHEEVTQELATIWEAHVRTTWTTAGFTVLVEADPQ